MPSLPSPETSGEAVNVRCHECKENFSTPRRSGRPTIFCGPECKKKAAKDQSRRSEKQRRVCFSPARVTYVHLWYRPTGERRDACARCGTVRRGESPPAEALVHRPFVELECE